MSTSLAPGGVIDPPPGPGADTRAQPGHTVVVELADHPGDLVVTAAQTLGDLGHGHVTGRFAQWAAEPTSSEIRHCLRPLASANVEGEERIARRRLRYLCGLPPASAPGCRAPMPVLLAVDRGVEAATSSLGAPQHR